MPQDFSGQNLRGRSFTGQNLSGADFSNADIRSADFSKANLRGANFKGAKAGLQRRWAIGLVMVSWVLSALSGILSIYDGFLVAATFDTRHLQNVFAGVNALIMIVVFFIITIRKGLVAGFGALVFAFGFALAFIFAKTGTVSGAMAGAIAAAGVVAGAVAVALAVALAVAVAGAVAVALAVAFAFAGAVAFAFAGAFSGAFAFAFAFAIAFSGAITLFNLYIGWRALAGDEKQAWIREVVIALAAIGGTSFRNADLTNADFTSATLKSTDFRRAILTRTRWHQSKKLDRVRPGTSYLKHAQVRQLLLTGQGQDKNFDREDLRGVNLQGVNLQDASFIGADLSEANLKDANLSRAKLKQTQLEGTDFTGATLTGAYIEDWGITSNTKFDGVRCEYVYMRLPTKENPDPLRKPDNMQEVFEDGGFGDFIKPIVDTLDLYHSQGVDPRAVAIAFKQLAENNPEAELELVAMEKRGRDKFLIRTKTAATANKSELSQEYFNTYNQLKALPEQEIKFLIAEKDNRIHSLETMVVTALQRPSFYAENYNNQGDTMSDKSETSNYDLRQAKFGGGFAGTGGTQSGGTFNDYSSNSSLSQAAAEIQQLLNQLSATNPTNTSAEKMTIAAKAVDEIEKNPALKARVVAALNSASIEAFNQAIGHPLAKNLMPIIEEWSSGQ